MTGRSQPRAPGCNMETCVLIPPELSLVLRCPQAEEGLSVWSNQRIPRGKRFLPFQGTVRLDRIDVFGKLDDADIRHRFGSFDEMKEVQPGRRKIRQCNWVRFLRRSPTFNGEVNLLATMVKGEPGFETVRLVLPDTELVAYFDEETSDPDWPLSGDDWLRARPFLLAQYKQTMSIIIEGTPLDLSKSLLTGKNHARLDSDKFPSPSGDQLANEDYCIKDKTLVKQSYSDTVSCNKRGKERALLPCEVCGKAFDRPSLLRRHMRTHTGEKPHVCDVCGKGFSTSSSLNTHRRIHSGEKPHQCPVCGKRFTASSNLYYHRMTHSKEKPHKCSLCSKSFPTPGDLKSHMYVHNGSWPYKCHVCSRGFSKQTNLKNHLFLHTGDKPHVCLHCQKRFALACNLRAHLKTHESEGIQSEQFSQPTQATNQVCVKCGTTFTSTFNSTTTSPHCPDCYHELVKKHGVSEQEDDEELDDVNRGSTSSAELSRAADDPSSPSPPPATNLVAQQFYEAQRHFVLSVLDQVRLRYEQALLMPERTIVKDSPGQTLSS